MVRVEFGPNVCSTVGALNVYTSHTLNLDNVRLLDYNEEDQTLELSPSPGEYSIDDVKFVVKDVQTIHALDSRMAREFNGYIEADNLDNIKKFINNAIKFSEDQRSMNENTDTIKIFQNNPIFGSGVKSFRYQCSKFEVKSKSNDQRCSTHTHNLFLEIISETGIIGILIFITFLFIFLKSFVFSI